MDTLTRPVRDPTAAAVNTARGGVSSERRHDGPWRSRAGEASEKEARALVEPVVKGAASAGSAAEARLEAVAETRFEVLEGACEVAEVAAEAAEAVEARREAAAALVVEEWRRRRWRSGGRTPEVSEVAVRPIHAMARAKEGVRAATSVAAAVSASRT